MKRSKQTLSQESAGAAGGAASTKNQSTVSRRVLRHLLIPSSQLDRLLE